MYNRLSFIDKFENYNIYNDNSITVTNTYKPLEIKYYNDNTYINLEKEFSHTLNKLYIYDEILKLQSEENTLDIFKKYILKYIPTLKNEEILFLYKKYKHTYNIEYQRVSIDNVNYLKFSTKHFSNYIIANGDNGIENPDTYDGIMTWVLLMSIASLGIFGIYICNRKLNS